MEAIEFPYLVSLETDAYLHPHTVASQLKPFLTESLSAEKRKQLITEIKCWEFFWGRPGLVPLIQHVSKNGSSTSYPDIHQFSQEEIEYITLRVHEAKHAFPKSRYSHLLWIRTKNNRFAQAAIDEYRKLAFLYYSNSINGSNSFYLFCQVLVILHSISTKVKHRQAEMKTELINWLNEEKIDLTWRGNILAIILDSPLFKKADFSGLTLSMLSSLERSIQSYSTTDDYLQYCLLLSIKEGVPSDEIYMRLGNNELGLAELKNTDESGLISMSCYQKAANYFKLGKNDKEYTNAVRLYTTQKDKLHFNLFQYEFSHEQVSQINERLNKVIDKMLSNKESSPLEYLVYNRHILMDANDLEKEAESAASATLAYVSNTSLYDNNNNFRQLNDEEDKMALIKYQIYTMHLQTNVIPLLSKLLYKGIRTGKFATNDIISFFSGTWFSKGLQAFNVDQQKETFYWIELLGPGLYDMISQLEAKILDNNFRPNYILAIDSLSTKIEGIIRDLARLAGKPVTKIKEDRAVEMNLEELLRDEAIAGLFKDYDILLWRYALTKSGWNMRNNTAHSFYRPGDYGENKALLLLLSLFRFCKYDDILEKETSQTDSL